MTCQVPGMQWVCYITLTGVFEGLSRALSRCTMCPGALRLCLNQVEPWPAIEKHFAHRTRCGSLWVGVATTVVVMKGHGCCTLYASCSNSASTVYAHTHTQHQGVVPCGIMMHPMITA